MSGFVKHIYPLLWRATYNCKFLHLGMSIRIRNVLKYASYRNSDNVDLKKYNVIIIIAAYNSEKWIEDTLNGIRVQTFQNYTVHIIDDGSTDRTSEIVEKFEIKDKRFKLYRNTKNVGSNLTRNVGLKIAAKDPLWNVYAVVDADDIPHPHWLEVGLKGIASGASVVRCIGTRCSADLSEKYYDYRTCAQIFATREIITNIGYYREYPFQEDHDFMERLEKAALLMNSFVITTLISCQLMRIHGENWTLQEKKLVQLACDEYSIKIARKATSLKDLYVEGIVPNYKRN